MNDARRAPAAGQLDASDIDDRMSAIGRAIQSDTASDDVLLLTDVIDEESESADAGPESAADAPSGREATAAIAGLLLEGNGLQSGEVSELLRAEFRDWLETEGREVLAQLLDELVERDEPAA